MQKIVINCEHGGFGLSKQAEQRYAELSGRPLPVYHWEIRRNCVHLVQVVKELGSAANGRYSELKVVEIPDEVRWHIHEYDGMEHVAEIHRTWN